jgi:hypothetical protein
MANDRSRMDEQPGGAGRNPATDMNDDRVPGPGDDVRGVGDEGDEEFEDTEDLDEEDEESDGTI